MIIYLIGQPCSGKTTISDIIKNKYLPNAVQLDGDLLRQFFNNFDYSKKGRLDNIRNAHKIALMLAGKQHDVIISLVSPYEETREELIKECDIRDIPLSIFQLEYDSVTEPRGREEFHIPDFEDLTLFGRKIPTDKMDVNEVVRLIVDDVEISDKIYHAVGQKDNTGLGTAAFIGRYQPWHPGHAWLIGKSLEKGMDVVILVRQCTKSSKNPLYPVEVKNRILEYYKNTPYSSRVSVIMIPDITTINFGRGVGYDVIEWIPPTEVGEISATKIRENGRF